MADQAPTNASFPLPDPDPTLLAPPGGDSREVERLYFDPRKWDAELLERFDRATDDPLASRRGRIEGQGTAALFLSDFHLADGTTAGDDFLESHLRADEDFGGLYTGFFPPGASRAGLFLQVLTFALRRLAERAGDKSVIDVVLNGDVINFLEMRGRGGTYVSDEHAPFFRALAGLRDRAAVYWLRGNHDYVVPSGPWRAGEYYDNPNLKTLVEHGDFWDKENWPPGPLNKGSRFVIEAASAFEVHGGVHPDGSVKYLMSGIDNLRPWSDEAAKAFLQRRAKYSDVAAMAAVLARFKHFGIGDDPAAFEGAKQRRQGEYRDWLMVQGHTHVPAAVPGVYYNLGTWMTTLVAPKGKEALVEAYPFLLVYINPAGERVEEYYFVRRETPGAAPVAVLQTPQTVNDQRREFGYPDLKV